MSAHKPPQNENKPPKSRSYIRGGLIAAFTVATIGGTAVWQSTSPASPYLHPRAAQAYHIPDKSCARTLLSQNPLPAAPQGAGQPVLLIPGFLGSDNFMQSLADRLSAAGYKTYGWNQGVNTGIKPELPGALQTRLENIAQSHPGQKITLIGYSLGGVYARELARQNSDKVAQVITLGAPFALTDKNGNLDPILTRTFNAFNSASDATGDTRSPLPVPTTSIFGLHDRIVDWRASLNERRADTENIPVAAGHWSLRGDARTAEIILHRLAETPDGWQPLAQKLCTPKIS